MINIVNGKNYGQRLASAFTNESFNTEDTFPVQHIDSDLAQWCAPEDDALPRCENEMRPSTALL